MGKEKTFENSIREYISKYCCEKAFGVKFWGGQAKIGNNTIKTQSGIPDLIYVVNGVPLYIEVKAEKGRPSDIQISNIVKLNKAGAIAIICYPKDFNALKVLLCRIMKGMPINLIREQYFATTKNI